MELKDVLFYALIAVLTFRFIARAVVTVTLAGGILRKENGLTISMAFLFGSGAIELLAIMGSVFLLYWSNACSSALMEGLFASMIVISLIRAFSMVNFTWHFYRGGDE